MLDTTSNGIFLHDLETLKLTMCNQSCSRMLGYTEEEFTKLCVADLHPEADLPFVYAQIEEFRRGGKPIRHDIRFKRKDGSILFADVSPHLVRLDGRQYMMVVLKSITEHTQANEPLQFTQFAIDHTADAAFWMTADGRFFYVNEAACRALGYSRTELLGMTVFDIDPAFTKEMWRESWRKLKAEKNIVLETLHRARDGRIYPVEIRANYLEFGGREYDCAFARDITERKRAQETLAESRKKYRRLVEKINDWVWEIDADGVYTYASPRALELLGYAPKEIVGKTPFDFMPPAEARRVWNAFQPIWLARKPLELLENTLVRKDGGLVTVETSGMPVFAEDGAFLGYTSIDRDVTSRKQAEAALREKEYLLSESQRMGHIGSWSVDLATRIGTWTRETYRLFGVAPDTFVPSADTLIGLLHPDDRDAMREWIRAALAGAPSGPLEFRVPLPDGSVRVLMGRGELIYDDDHRPIRLVGTAQDVTERKQAEEAVRESEERYRILLEQGFDGIFVHEDFRIVQLNDRLAEMTGYPRAELMGSKAIDLFTPSSRERIRRYIESGAKGYYEIELRRRDGRTVDVESYGAPCRFQGRSARIVGLRDITERKRAQEALCRMNEHLELQVAQRTEDLRCTVNRLRQLTLELSQAEDRERRRIADILHDDVQQTLAAAKFHLNLLTSEPRSAEESREIIEQVRHMLKDAIEKSRRLSHELSPALYQVDLAGILEWLARQMQQKHGLTVHVEVHGPVDSPSEPLKAFLYKVAQELLFNVVKHAGVNEAGIRVRRLGRCLYLSVTDRGRGFDPQRPEGAAGFGLLGIRERVQLLGGRMKIRSRSGMGSRLSIAIPDQETAGASAL